MYVSMCSRRMDSNSVGIPCSRSHSANAVRRGTYSLSRVCGERRKRRLRR